MANFNNNRRTYPNSGQKTAQKGVSGQPRSNGQQNAKKPRITARIDNLVDREDTNIKAYASATDGVFAIKGIKVIDSQKGTFVQMPQRSYEKNGETKYVPVAHPVTSEARDAVIDAVMRAYDQALVESMKQQNGQNGDNPGDMSEQGYDDLPFEPQYAQNMAQSM